MNYYCHPRLSRVYVTSINGICMLSIKLIIKEMIIDKLIVSGVHHENKKQPENLWLSCNNRGNIRTTYLFSIEMWKRHDTSPIWV
jgi:hypothetical protein